MNGDTVPACAWTGKDKKILAPNIVSLTQRFNHTVLMVQVEILKHKNEQDRSKTISAFINICLELKKDRLRGFHSLVAIVSALQSAPIYRLRATWDELFQNEDSKSAWLELEELASIDKKRAKLRSKIEELNLPCIPFIGMYLNDLEHITTAKKSQIPLNYKSISQNTNANFVSTQVVDKILLLISTFQGSNYLHVKPNSKLQEFILSFSFSLELRKIIEDEMFRFSMQVEGNKAVSGRVTVLGNRRDRVGDRDALSGSPLTTAAKDPNIKAGTAAISPLGKTKKLIWKEKNNSSKLDQPENLKINSILNSDANNFYDKEKTIRRAESLKRERIRRTSSFDTNTMSNLLVQSEKNEKQSQMSQGLGDRPESPQKWASGNDLLELTHLENIEEASSNITPSLVTESKTFRSPSITSSLCSFSSQLPRNYNGSPERFRTRLPSSGRSRLSTKSRSESIISGPLSDSTHLGINLSQDQVQEPGFMEGHILRKTILKNGYPPLSKSWTIYWMKSHPPTKSLYFYEKCDTYIPKNQQKRESYMRRPSKRIEFDQEKTKKKLRKIYEKSAINEALKKFGTKKSSLLPLDSVEKINEGESGSEVGERKPGEKPKGKAKFAKTQKPNLRKSTTQPRQTPFNLTTKTIKHTSNMPKEILEETYDHRVDMFLEFLGVAGSGEKNEGCWWYTLDLEGNDGVFDICERVSGSIYRFKCERGKVKEWMEAIDLTIGSSS